MQQAGGDGGRVHLHLRQHLGDFEGVNDVGLAGGSHLALMMADAELPGLADQSDVFTGTIGLDVLQQRLEALGNSLLCLRLDLSGGRLDIEGRNRHILGKLAGVHDFQFTGQDGAFGQTEGAEDTGQLVGCGVGGFTLGRGELVGGEGGRGGIEDG